ncbi:NusG domain II-containing protein [Lacticaseibacillus mingshuiensis]|uniref:NusG domain II-containing protein n=1 Tax=Lacticaseibacillus mingshuiensis TaxID=2799574 RepID=A0ABW4CIZ5_9LACO|nr:NusG domain II-containing protein [Lacticaseibacillus mingshuiensis]
MRHWLRHYTRPFDYVLLAVLIPLCFLPWWLWSRQQAAQPSSNLIAVISIDGQEVRRIKLGRQTPHTQFTLHPAPGQYNVIEVDGARIRDKEDNTPDQIAVHTSWISKPGQQSICLPHKLIIMIQAGDDPNAGGLVQP